MKKWPLIPDWIKDWTNKLPWHSKDDERFKKHLRSQTKRGLLYNKPTEDRKWSYRKIDSIKGVCFHQSAGFPYDNPMNTNNYHIGPNHITDQGCPHICYTFFIGKDGEIYLCNPLHCITWSQGDKDQPGSENRMLISVVVSGHFRSKSNPTYGVPTQSQTEACQQLWIWLRDRFDLTEADIFGHFDFGKTNCPGTDLENWILRTRTNSGLLVLADVIDWQNSLKDFGYNVGKIDGIFGPKTKYALVQFQRDHQLNPTGNFDRPTAWMMRLVKQNKVEFIEFSEESIVL